MRRRSIAAFLTGVVGLCVPGCGLHLDFDPSQGDRPGTGWARCDAPPDAHTVALFRMEEVAEDMLLDATGRHDGYFANGPPGDTEGPDGCGRALLTPPAGEPPLHGTIPSHPDWQLPSGSVSFWFRRPERIPDACQGIVSRDAGRQLRGGHLSIYSDNGGGVTVRLQSLAPAGGGDGPQLVIGSDAPIPADRWVFIGVNFGSPAAQLFVAGELQSRVGSDCFGGRPNCDPECMLGIDGNDNPWMIGALATSSPEGTNDNPQRHLEGAAIDELRISSVRRAF